MSLKSPPVSYLKIIARECHKALRTYLDLWEKMNDNYKVYVELDEINDDFLTSRTVFRNNLMALHAAMLVNYKVINDAYFIELTGWDSEEEFIRS